MHKALNTQIQKEYHAAYLYLSMAAYLESESLSGLASWMKNHAKEELTHAQKIYDYVLERGSVVTLLPIEGPKTKWKSPLEAFEDAYEHEVKVSKIIDGLVDLAHNENDKASFIFLQWFVTEQVEEEQVTSEMVETLKKVGTNVAALLALDRSLRK